MPLPRNDMSLASEFSTKARAARGRKALPRNDMSLASEFSIKARAARGAEGPTPI